jgi:hypothetical protein
VERRTQLIYPGDDTLVLKDAEANRGWDRGQILELLEDQIASRSCELVDGSQLSDGERNDLYLSAMVSHPRREVKGVFDGPPGHPTHLGKHVPALVEFEGARISAIYPRDLGD